MKVYLAGPDVFLPNAKEHGEALKAVCREFGLTGLFPLDPDLRLEGLPKEQQARRIFEANMDLLRSSQAVIANMTPFRGPSMDVGTAWEMGCAFGLRIPVYAYTTDPTSFPDRVLNYRALMYTGTTTPRAVPIKAPDDPAFLEDFGLHDNLMLDCSAIRVYSSFREAAEALSKEDLL